MGDSFPDGTDGYLMDQIYKKIHVSDSQAWNAGERLPSTDTDTDTRFPGFPTLREN